MLQILRRYQENEQNLIEYTRDGETVSHIIRTPIYQPTNIEETKLPSFEEMQMQTLLNTEYLVIISELTNY